MKIGFYAGSFDPFTLGHLHVIKCASKLFDKVVVGIGVNAEKQRRFDRKLMLVAMEQVLLRENLNNVEVVCYDNLSVETAKKHDATFLIRGIRNCADYEYEEKVANFNKQTAGLETIYINAGEYEKISSSAVMELLQHNQDVSQFLPPEIAKLVD